MSGKTIAYTADLPSLVERYFCEYLIRQRNASPETISSYRDAFRLFLRFSEQQFGRAPATLTLADFDAPQILAFLDSLETQRRCSVRSRNARLAALRSFLQYAVLQEPTAFGQCFPARRDQFNEPWSRWSRRCSSSRSQPPLQVIP